MPSTKKPKRPQRKTARSNPGPAQEVVTPTAHPPDPDLTEGVVAVADLDLEDLEGLALAPIPRIPIFVAASGVYTWTNLLRPFPPLEPIPIRPIPVPIPITPIPHPTVETFATQEVAAEADRAGLTQLYFQREVLRLDVDGRYPQMVASGTIYSGLTLRIHWIANLTKVATDLYEGPIWYKDGAAAWLPQTNVTIKVVRSFYANQRKATVTFKGGGAPDRLRAYSWNSAHFHPVEFEFDTVEGVQAITEINTGDHPNRPAGLPVGPLSIQTVYRQAGIDATLSPFSGPIPLTGAGGNQKWSDMEMHDAMQLYWSRFADKPQWAMWVLFASLHEQGTSLGGIMFDDIGPNHRQGTAIFNDSFIKNAPAGDPAPDAWVRRMKFWTAVHEMGHGFNLAHSWQKAMVYQGHGPWIPLANEPEARSFMNYPYNVSGGQAAFFADFMFRFTDSELLFLRHAPERFVQMGNAEWFDHHGFEQADTRFASSYGLELRTHREGHFEFMEPVVAELKLSNQSDEPVIVDTAALQSSALTVVVQRRGRPAKLWRPYAERCTSGEQAVLMPRRTPEQATGEAIYAALPLVGGIGGWAIDEPGDYMVQVALRIDEEDVVSKPLAVRVLPPRSFDEQHVAQDFFTEDVGRVLAFSGSRFLTRANQTLQEVVARLGGMRVVNHALFALAGPVSRHFRVLDTSGAVSGAEFEPAGGLKFKTLAIDSKSATKELKAALTADPVAAVETFGHIGYRQKMEYLGAFLADEGERPKAAQCLIQAEKTLKARGVIAPVLKQLKEQAQAYSD